MILTSGRDQVIAAAITMLGTMAIAVLLFAAVYDRAQVAKMPVKQRLGFCLRQLGSSWPWR